METVVKDIFVMDGGRLTVEGSTLVPGTDYGVPRTIPVQYFLVETTKGYMLIDSGNDPDVITDPIGAWGFDLASASNPEVQPHNHPLEQLKLVGLEASDIKVVIYTHLHHDHCGAARFFPNALHVVQKAEHRWAFQPDSFAKKPYNQKDFRHDLRWQLAEGDWCILPGVHLVSTPGHTPGHQSIVLWDTPNAGTVILAGDAVNCCANIELDVPPGITSDNAAAVASLHRLSALAAAADATMLVSHDAEFFEQLPKAPDALRQLPADLRRFYMKGVRHLYDTAANPDNIL
jgi:N-acyl homoserine lactone hydrolase